MVLLGPAQLLSLWCAMPHSNKQSHIY